MRSYIHSRLIPFSYVFDTIIYMVEESTDFQLAPYAIREAFHYCCQRLDILSCNLDFIFVIFNITFYRLVG